MEKRRLGNTNIQVTPIGLGCWQFSGGRGLAGGYWPALSQPLVQEIVGAALRAGVNWFDTAEVYGAGRSEAALAEALTANGRRDGEVVIATKWLPFFRTARSIERTIDARLSRLGGFSIDLHQIHSPYGAFSGHGKLLDAMARLVERGNIRAIGISNFNARQMRRAHAHLARLGLPLASNQVRYSLLDRRIERNGVLDAAKELGISIIAYSPLAQGVLSGKFHDQPALLERVTRPRRYQPAFRQLEKSRPLLEALKRIGAKHRATPAQVALNWVVTFHGPAVVAIPGASSVKQAEDNAAALGFALEPDELAEIDRLSATASHRA